ncbi:hydroxyacid dehydrogenase [Humibacter ginsenosidimutans]|uniref:Hydroxyacid dehydrogenase n=1 Tax=Humibacter ginsenosidimutans TaxID=2599293 RepID=A0A5B8M480_9MICO|nr:hydroxyacid dehydrogenase [Humibacter ginsenosidimutans]QDZ15377.1 hydroxyacid dehydrogenase [Humibacter ginsenosidimutans]
MSSDSLADVFSASARKRLESAVELIGPQPITDFTTQQARAALLEAEIMITGWETPTIDGAVIASAPKLEAIVHAAGTVKTFLSEEVFDHGILVTSCAAANAIPVAEFTVACIVFGLKRANRFAHRLRTTHGVRSTEGMPRLGANNVTIGLVGASRVGREVIRLLRSYDVSVIVSDPYLSHGDAEQLGVQGVTLRELCMRSDVISVHAPLNESTLGLIGAEQLALLHDGAVVINTARGALIDTAALEAELATGRLDAYLDVTDPEPLPERSPLYGLPNVTLTPHIAGALGNEVLRLGDLAVAEVSRVAQGLPLEHEVRLSDLAHIA